MNPAGRPVRCRERHVPTTHFLYRRREPDRTEENQQCEARGWVKQHGVRSLRMRRRHRSTAEWPRYRERISVGATSPMALSPGRCHLNSQVCAPLAPAWTMTLKGYQPAL